VQEERRFAAPGENLNVTFKLTMGDVMGPQEVAFGRELSQGAHLCLTQIYVSKA
jgi:hypothetical protein